MRRTKELLILLRDGIALTFTWLLMIVVIASLIYGNEALDVSLIIKIFALCVWGVFCFIVSFKFEKVMKKGFIFSLTLFYILFIPVEVTMFYFMGLFKTAGRPIQWIIFACIVVAAYLVSLFIDIFVMKKKEKLYTEKVSEYIQAKCMD